MPTIDVYFDFISPYSYLALVQLPAFAAEHDVTWKPCPVVYGVLLDRTGLVGPVEVDSKRRYTFADIRRAAALLDIPLVGPPGHPFRSLDALRTVCLFGDRSEWLELAISLARACWGEGLDLTDLEVLAACVHDVGLDADDLGARLQQGAIKQRLRDGTEQALGAGVFGVPTLRWNDELFWGHDRLPHLAARLSGRIPSPLDSLDRLLERPRSADRASKPGGA